MPFPSPARLTALLLHLLLAGAAIAAEAPAPAPAAPAPDAVRRLPGASGLPLPRFASVASGEVNVRTGPGMQFPIRWVYTRPGLPVRVVEEHDNWRRVEDPDGTEGWTQSNLLSTRRTVLVAGGTREVRRKADPDARVLLRAEAGVLADLLECAGEWCRVELADKRGWLPRDGIWGVLPGE